MNPKARCCWCGSPFVQIAQKHPLLRPVCWCRTPICRRRQADHSIAVTDGSVTHYLYVPLPKQVDLDSCMERYLLGGGAAGVSKSHAARWSMYRRCLAIPGYEGLILRETWDELNKHHFRLMAEESNVFRAFGFDVKFSITNREMTFPHGSVIEGGHMEKAEDVKRYLSRERDEIAADEGVQFDPRALLELSTRARSTKPRVLAYGSRGLFRVYTNPGGPSGSMLRDFFINHTPNWDEFPAELRRDYRSSEWVYIPGNLEDNPYLSEHYERDLAILAPWRYQQLRHNDWDIVAGLFFHEFLKSTHVADLGSIGGDYEWFRSLDWGFVNPGCTLWWACLPDARYYIRYAHKFQLQAIEDVAEDIIDVSSKIGSSYIRYTVADPNIWGPGSPAITNRQEFVGEDIAETFMKSGVPMIKGDNRSRTNGWVRVREMLRLRPDGKPTITIHPDDCQYLIRTLSDAVSAKNNPEDIGSIDDHPLDALRYGAMSRPSPTRQQRAARSGKTFNAARGRIVEFKRAMAVR